MTLDKECTLRCVRKGSKYGLWVGHRVYVLEPREKAAQFAAKDVAVKGELKGEVIQISSIEEIRKPASDEPGT